MIMQRSRLTATIIALLVGCSRQRSASIPVAANPIATCGSEAAVSEALDVRCLSLRLTSLRAKADHGGSYVDGVLRIDNRCAAPIALLTAPIDTRLPLATTWEESLSSIYARFEVFEAVPHSEPLDDRGVSVRALPSFIVIPARAKSEIPLSGRSARLTGLLPGKQYRARFCTFVAPARWNTSPSASALRLEQSIEVFQRVHQPCDARRRLATRLVCTSDVQLSVLSVE
jgi:hypothetical protein